MARLLILFVLIVGTACASPETGNKSGSVQTEEVASDGGGSTTEKSGMSTGTKVAVGVGAGALTALVIFGIVTAVGTAALMSNMSGP